MAQSLLEDLPEQAFTDATIRRMYDLINRGKVDPTFQKLIYSVVNSSMPGQWKNYRQELANILKWARTVADYRRDPYGVELLQDVWATMDRKRGDCIPLTEKIVVRRRSTGRYEIVPIGNLRDSYSQFEALSYNFQAEKWEFKEITRWVDKGIKKTFSVRMSNGTSFRCTEDHKLFTYKQHAGYKRRHGLKVKDPSLFDVRTLGEINRVSAGRPALAMAARIPVLDSSLNRSEERLWCLGLYVAEGWKQGRHNERVQISGDGHVRDRLCEKLNAIGAPYSKSKREVSSYVSLLKSDFRSEFLADCLGGYAWEKDLPEDLLSMGFTQIDSFLDGYGLGDDFVPTNGQWKRRVERVHNTCSLELAKKLMFFHRLKGEPSSLWTQRDHGGAGKHTIYRVLVWKRDGSLDSSHTRFKERLPGVSSCHIKEVVDAGEELVCDITVDGNHNFVLENGVIAHNCDDFTVLLCAAAEVLGCPCRIVTVSTRKDRTPNHVYPEANVNGKWLGMDATMQGTALGWQPSRVTDKKIWTRRELGLAGGESDLEGLGMMGNGYHDVPGFKSSLYPVSDRLAPGVPDDIAETFADPRKGNQVPSRRPIWNAPIANNADRTSNPRAGGGVYQPALPIKSMPTPSEIWSLIDRKYVPKILDPDSAWWGKIPTSKEDLNRMFPGSEGTMSSYLTDIASVPASAIAELTQEVAQRARLEGLGEHEVGEAIEDALQGYALGLSPKMRRGFRRDAPQKGQNVRPGPVSSKPPLPYEKKYMIPGPRRLIRRGGHLNGLGSILDDLAKVAADAVKAGATPTAAVNAAIDTVQGAVLPKPTVTTTVATVAKTAIPVGMIALVVGAALLMSRSGGARKYRSNPSRRRSRGSRRGRSGGMDMQKILLLGGAGAAAWYLFLRPGATMLPASIKPGATVVKPPSTSDRVQAAVIAAAPSIFDAIKNLFSPGTPVQGAVTDLDTAQGAALPGVVTDWSTL